MEIKKTQFLHGNFVQTIALYAGIAPSDLSKLLCASFGFSGNILGFQRYEVIS